MPNDRGAGFASLPNVEAQQGAEREVAAEAIAPLANLPLFFKLAERRAVVAGGSEAAAWKAELLAAAGARVEVFAPAPSTKMEDIAARPQGVRLERRSWRADDLAQAAIAVGDFADRAESAAFRAAGHAAGAPVNVIDQPEFCDFAFGAIVNRSPLVIGVSTDGASPVFGQALRGRLEALLPQSFAAWAAAAESWRDHIQAPGASFRRRRVLWERFAALALAKADRAPSEEDRLALLAAAREDAAAAPEGEAIVIFAGSGGADLLTLRAWRALQSADAIVFDDLVPPESLDLARREAHRIKAGGRRDLAETAVALCREGKKVVLLKSGAAALSRGDEVATLRQAGIACVVIPGVSEASIRAAERQP
jgi:uroporphyrin-III C-methyltransferase / precorrin-2 dehydrogenase / sirohydrochlorin ferrochelatase